MSETVVRAESEAIAAYLRDWAADLDRQFQQQMDMYGPGYRYGRPAPDREDEVWRWRSQASDLRRRARDLDPACAVCNVEGGHDDWCEPEWRS